MALYFAGSVIAQDAPIKEYSSDNRLMSNVVTAGVLENGMVIHTWEWNDIAKALDPRYGSEDGFVPAGLIAQDVRAKHPDAGITDETGYLRVDLAVLVGKDEIIAAMEMKWRMLVPDWLPRSKVAKQVCIIFGVKGMEC